MNTTNRLEMRRVDDLVPYVNNARTHSPEQVAQLRASLREFGFVTPVLINADGTVLAGHGRLQAAKAEGIEEAPCVLVEWLTEAQQKAFILADNRLAENAGWDTALVSEELEAIRDAGMDLTLTGFTEDAIILEDTPEGEHFWGDDELESSEEYEEFLKKFQSKKTTDDCYTPAVIYDTIKAWAVERYQLAGAKVIRPFYPNGDYQKEDYPDGSVVIDNPPFSCLSEICAWYEDHGVRYFLFAPALTHFSIYSGRCNYVVAFVPITYENGANVNTSFVTNLGEFKVEYAPDLYQQVKKANAEWLATQKKELPKYAYPMNVITNQTARLAIYGDQPFRLRAEECSFTRALDSQKAKGTAIFGAGFIISEKAAAEKAAAEKAAAEKAATERWPLSDREEEIIRTLGTGGDDE